MSIENEINEEMKALEDEFKFKRRKDPADAAVEYLDFEDGRKYKFQHPSFLEP